jgi:hypothetical protein
MSELLSELQHSCPCDSYVDAFVRKRSNGYDVTICIRCSQGEFTARTSDPDLDCALQQGSDSIVVQIRKWHKKRFINDS